MILVGKFWSDAVPAASDSLTEAGSGTAGVETAGMGAPEVAAAATTEMAAARSSLGSSVVEMPEWGSLLMQFGLALLVVVGLILVLQKVARRFGSQWKRGRNFDDIQVLAERSMGQKLSLAIVEVSDQRWLVSISPQGIQRVADIDYEMAPPVELLEGASAVAVGADPDPRPAVGGLSSDEFTQFEQQLKSRLQVTGSKYASLREMEAKP